MKSMYTPTSPRMVHSTAIVLFLIPPALLKIRPATTNTTMPTITSRGAKYTSYFSPVRSDWIIRYCYVEL
jgi:hypothetical protein